MARAIMTAAATLNLGAHSLHFFSGPLGASGRRLTSSLSRTSPDRGRADVVVAVPSSASSSRARMWGGSGRGRSEPASSRSG